MLREALRLPLRISDRDIAYMLWLSKHRRMTAKTAGAAVTEAATAHRIRQQLYSVPGDTRYRVIFDDAIPENIEPLSNMLRNDTLSEHYSRTNTLRTISHYEPMP